MRNGPSIRVREYALLIRDGSKTSIDCHSIPSSAFDWLMTHGLSTNDKAVGLVRVKRKGGALVLQVLNYVGVLETPCGVRIEILPKIANDERSSDQSVDVFLKMLQTVLRISSQEYNESSLRTVEKPLFEILLGYFLVEARTLIKKGLRSTYERVEEHKRYLKGQLLLHKQLRQRPGAAHFFHISNDRFTINRPENRLLHSALRRVVQWTRSKENHRMAKEMLRLMSDIPQSSHISLDFRKWSDERSLIHYRKIKNWCELILTTRSPISFLGKYKGLSFLFRMENLFEQYVSIVLQRKLPSHLSMATQVRSAYLIEHEPFPSKKQQWFALKPDIVISDKKSKKRLYIIDAKWKRISADAGNKKEKYNILQSDLYQMFAYGHKYLHGEGDMFLLYPRSGSFSASLPPFLFHKNLRVTAVSFDLLTDTCILIDLFHKDSQLVKE